MAHNHWRLTVQQASGNEGGMGEGYVVSWWTPLEDGEWVQHHAIAETFEDMASLLLEHYEGRRRGSKHDAQYGRVAVYRTHGEDPKEEA